MLGNRRSPLYQESSVSACCSIPFTQFFFVLAPRMPSSARLIGAPYLCGVSLLQVLVPSAPPLLWHHSWWLPNLSSLLHSSVSVLRAERQSCTCLALYNALCRGLSTFGRNK